MQIQFSLLSPNFSNLDIQNLYEERNIQILAYSPLAFGLLAVPPDQSRIPVTLFRRNIFLLLLPSTKFLRRELNRLAIDRGVSQAQVALNWCRAHGAMPIPGIRNSKQVKEAGEASKWILAKREKHVLDRLRENCEVRIPVNPY